MFRLAGTYSVTVTDLLQCETDTFVNIVTLPQPCLLSVSEVDQLTFTISPNPTSGKFQLNFAENGVKTENIQVVNGLGQSIKFSIRNINSTSFEVNLSDAESGIYFVKISNGTRTSIERIVKQ